MGFFFVDAGFQQCRMMMMKIQVAGNLFDRDFVVVHKHNNIKLNIRRASGHKIVSSKFTKKKKNGINNIFCKKMEKLAKLKSYGWHS